MPDAPSDFTVLATTNSTALRATWNEPLDPNGVLTGYRLNVRALTRYLSPEDSGYNEQFNFRADEFSFVISGLHPFASYDCELRASTSVGFGTETTVEAETSPDGKFPLLFP